MDVDKPEIGPDDVLVRVHAAALNPYDWHILRGDPYVARLMGAVGLTKPKPRVAGVDGAGRVEAVGANVRGLRPGDEVLGSVRGGVRRVRARRGGPGGAQAGQAHLRAGGGVTMAGQTALRAIRDAGQVQAGQRVLVNGAAGGVGSFAVQIAAALGAEVTGVCSTGNVELVRSIGAAHVVDYTKDDFTDGRVRYDVIQDNVGNQPLRRLRRALTPTGTLVINAGGSPDGRLFGPIGAILRAGRRQRIRAAAAPAAPGPRGRGNTCSTVTELIEAGQLTPVIGRTYPLADTAAGLRYLEQGHARGKVVVTVP